MVCNFSSPLGGLLCPGTSPSEGTKSLGFDHSNGAGNRCGARRRGARVGVHRFSSRLNLWGIEWGIAVAAALVVVRTIFAGSNNRLKVGRPRIWPAAYSITEWVRRLAGERDIGSATMECHLWAVGKRMSSVIKIYALLSRRGFMKGELK